ncbi:unnamed protein product [Prorocentrum cordatum]|uniref:Uncharacterized protein n=1 Tax=Prorocentrum cordatum TaxID=2364126 RepID=A0ABN9WE94_9DINO|nr:unnamed protein product [Polarella glacialis]
MTPLGGAIGAAPGALRAPGRGGVQPSSKGSARTFDSFGIRELSPGRSHEIFLTGRPGVSLASYLAAVVGDGTKLLCSDAGSVSRRSSLQHDGTVFAIGWNLTLPFLRPP